MTLSLTRFYRPLPIDSLLTNKAFSSIKKDSCDYRISTSTLFNMTFINTNVVTVLYR